MPRKRIKAVEVVGVSSVQNTIKVERLVFSVKEFCAAHDISIGTFHALRQEGKAPKMMKVKGRVMISVEDAAVWRAKMAEAA